MRRYLIFSVVGLVLFLASISATTVSVAFPAIISELDASVLVVGWVLSIYQLVAVITMPIAAKMSETFGRKRIFMMSTLFFTVGSVLCAIAPNATLLIIFRVVQGIGGGGFLPAASGIVSDEFPEMRERAIGLFASIHPIGAIVGPNLGGWMVASWGWQSVFWFNVPLGIVVLILARQILRAGSGNGSRRIDFVGAGLLAGSLSALMLALAKLGNGESAVSYTSVGVLAFVSIILLIAFVRWERTAADPIVDLELIQSRPFLGANIYNLIYGACAFGIFSLMPLYAVSVYGMTIFQSGLLLTPRSIGMTLASAVTSIYLVRWGYRWPMLIGTVIIVVSLFSLSQKLTGVSILGLDLSATMVLLIIMLVSGIGSGVSVPAANNACIALMPDRVATITGLRGMFRQMGGALSITIATLLLHSGESMARAFYLTFVFFGIIMLLSILAIFTMPERLMESTEVAAAAEQSRSTT
ncbi:MAG: DHA2 family efflux MFS transporter permease subunit [Chloroflexi bacterium]|nr:DHA2 family efflux MFS transporter permease subunit [Chloroflexota bacterium]